MKNQDIESTLGIDPKHFSIDEQQLVEEWVEHPSRVFYYARLAADIQMSLDEARRHDEVLRADLSLDIRKNPDEFGLQKTTEGLVNAAIESNEDVQVSAKKIIRLKNELDYAKAAVSALESKKKALECIVQLHATSYFATPRTAKSDYRAPGIKPKARDKAE
jgi:hypothetical protein